MARLWRKGNFNEWETVFCEWSELLVLSLSHISQTVLCSEHQTTAPQIKNSLYRKCFVDTDSSQPTVKDTVLHRLKNTYFYSEPLGFFLTIQIVLMWVAESQKLLMKRCLYSLVNDERDGRV